MLVRGYPWKIVQTPGVIVILFDDPKAYTKPWGATVGFELLPNTELIENICENEKDVAHLVGK